MASKPSSRFALAIASSIALAIPISGLFAAPGMAAAPILAADTDGDTLPDSWEINGYDANGDGVIDVNLPAMGANPNRKDLFVEMDYMSGRLASATALDRIVAVFAAAPVSNPNGTTGITLHLDAGSARGAAYNLGGGNQVPYDSNLQPSLSQTNAIKTSNFNSRRKAVFYYMLWADDYDGTCSSGQAFSIPNDTFIVTMGPRCGWTPGDDENVGTFIHEFGHNLGLKHGGTDHTNYKPNYLSVMNYFFQFKGVPKTAGGANFGYSDFAPPALDEASLRESVGLNSPGASAWKTKWRCPNGSTRTTTGAANGPIDWNCDGDTSDTARADINGSGGIGTLTAQNNWASIVFGGGAVGGSGASQLSRTDDGTQQELTKQDWDKLSYNQ